MKTTILALLLSITSVIAALPPAPADYFNDYAGVVSPATKVTLNHALAENERKTSNQIVVAIFPDMGEGASDSASRTTEIAKSWKIGQAGKRNGALFAVYMKEHQMFIATGYGLEGALPDATCFHLTRDVMRPYMRSKQYDEGFTDVTNQLIKLTDPEFKGTGKTVAESHNNGSTAMYVIFILLIIAGCGIVAYLVFKGSDDEESSTGSFPMFPTPQPPRRYQYPTSASRISQRPPGSRSRESTTYVPIYTPSYDSGSSSHGSSSSDSSSSSFSSDSFSCGGGDFGGGGGGSSW